MERLDDHLLCCYLDGRLGINETVEIADRITADPELRDRLVQLLGVKVRLRAFGQEITEEPVPERLLASVRRSNGKRARAEIFAWPVLRYAAVLVLMLGGFFAGRLSPVDQKLAGLIFPVVPIELQQVVNATLELEPSGQGRSWQDNSGLSARVVPVRTFRGENGEYYRMYTLELTQDEQVQQYVALARRTGKESWQTRSLQLEESVSQI